MLPATIVAWITWDNDNIGKLLVMCQAFFEEFYRFPEPRHTQARGHHEERARLQSRSTSNP